MPATSTKLLQKSTRTAPPPPFFAVVVLGSLVIVGAGLRSVGDIVGPVFLVVTLVITVYPLRAWLVRRRVPQVVASILALLVVYAVLIVVLGSVVWSLTRLATTLPDYSAEFTQLYNQALGQLNRLGISTATLSNAASQINLSTFAGLAQSLLAGVTNGLSLLALMLATIFFLVFDAAGIEDRIALIARDRPQVATALTEFAHSVRLYWVVTTVFGLIVAVLDVVALAIISVPYAFTWGVLASSPTTSPTSASCLVSSRPRSSPCWTAGWVRRSR